MLSNSVYALFEDEGARKKLNEIQGQLNALQSSIEFQLNEKFTNFEKSNKVDPKLINSLSERINTLFDDLSKLRGNPLLAKDKRGIYFDFNKYVVKQEYMEVIQAHAKYLNETPAANMKIQGNTDYRGSHEYNLSLGQKRAVAVKEALNSFGVDDSQIETVSYGKEYANLDCVEQNSCGEDRRADIVYTVE